MAADPAFADYLIEVSASPPDIRARKTATAGELIMDEIQRAYQPASTGRIYVSNHQSRLIANTLAKRGRLHM